MYRYGCDGDDGRNNCDQHRENEPGGPFCSLRRGLGDAHGVDKGVRDEEEKLHVFFDMSRGNGSREALKDV